VIRPPAIAAAARGAAWLALLLPLGCRDVYDVEPEPLGVAKRWATSIDHVGTSSPRLADLTGDGVLDVVVGGGKESQSGTVSALDGIDGSLVWQVTYDDQVYATACLVEIDDDGVPDVVVGRRKTGGDLDALSGRDGALLWTLRTANPDEAFPELHFNSPTRCPDVDGDGRDDLLSVQGGGRDVDRVPAVLRVVASRSGRILAATRLPGDLESYVVPTVERRDDGTTRLLVGTGGETVPGAIASLDFPSLETRWSVPTGSKGQVAGLLLHDFSGDGMRDVVTTTFDGTVLRLDGETGAERWRVPHEGFECYVTPALGRFGDGDERLDVVAAFSQGTWPVYEKPSRLEWIDGETGEVLASREWGVLCQSSPVVLDVEGDGFDEVVHVTNMTFGIGLRRIPSKLGIFSGRRARTPLHLRMTPGFSAATPWVGDHDGDGRLGLVHVSQGRVTMLDLAHHDDATVRWNQYRGPNADNVVPSP